MRSRKLIYIICLAVAVLLNAFYDAPEMLILFIIIVLVGLVSWFICMLSSSNIKLFCFFAENDVNKGDTLTVKFKLTNKFKIPMPWCSLSAYADINNNGGSGCYNVELAEKTDNGDTLLEIPMKHCGIVKLSIDRLICRDYMQIFSTSIKYNYTNYAVVFPELIELNEVMTKEAESEEDYRFSYSETDNTEIMDFREYREGDVINHIHWQLSAVADDYIIKQYGEEIERYNYIIVDLVKKPQEDFRDDLDLIYQAAYSIGNIYAKNGIRASFLAWDGAKRNVYDGMFKDSQQLERCMADLMKIECGDDSLDSLDRYIKDKAGIENEWNDNCNIIITTSDLTNDEYRIFNVKQDDLKEMLLDIADSF